MATRTPIDVLTLRTLRLALRSREDGTVGPTDLVRAAEGRTEVLVGALRRIAGAEEDRPWSSGERAALLLRAAIDAAGSPSAEISRSP